MLGWLVPAPLTKSNANIVSNLREFSHLCLSRLSRLKKDPTYLNKYSQYRDDSVYLQNLR